MTTARDTAITMLRPIMAFMTSDKTSDALTTNLARAKAYYDEKQYPKAAAIFKQIANSCVCGVQVRTSPCCCKALVPAIANGAVDAELRKKCICSARSDVRCKSAEHLDALDGLAAVHEAKRLVDMAIVIAEAMINLAPREPKGFLRLGRILRLQRSYRQALQTYQQGIELVGKKNPSHPLLPMLHQMRDKVKYPAVATDPLPVLPLELVTLIFKNLDFRSLCRCLRVSKSWKNLLTSQNATIQSLWRVQHFDRCTKHVRPASIQKYATYAGFRVTELVIVNCRTFGNWNVLRWIAGSCRSLQVLKLRGPREVGQFPASFPLGDLCVPQLTSLYLGFYAPFVLEFINKIVSSSATTLQELTILNFPSRLTKRVEAAETVNWPVLDRLRVLRLGGPPHFGAGTILEILSFASSTPNVEEVWLEGLFVPLRNLPEPLWTPWPHLKRLFVGQHVAWQWSFHIPRLLPFLLPSGLEELHVMCYGCGHTSTFSWAVFAESDEMSPEPKNLRRFTLRDRIPGPSGTGWPEHLQNCVRPSLESGSLKELGMVFPRPHPSWLRSNELKFLSLKGLSMEFSTHLYAIDEALSDFLDRFPNLEGLDIAEEPFSNAALARAIQRGVKLIYHRGDNNMRTEVREWALEKHNARIVKGDYVTNLPIYPRDEKFKDFY
ncbi:hypothetical protein GGR55DRAFT_578557 [Xylaria sp. FL0064]|nr:hypothetical protein GGR55DRAFT_578557 [Xylaria sp. FL0064]